MNILTILISFKSREIIVYKMFFVINKEKTFIAKKKSFFYNRHFISNI